MREFIKGGGYYKLINKMCGKALDNGNVTTDASKTMQWTDNGGDPQKWIIQ